MEKAIKKFFGKNKQDKIFSYDEFSKISEHLINETDDSKLNETDKFYHDYRKINLQRTNRITKTFKPNNVVLEAVKKISKPQTWLVVTEDWCGDSAQNLPYIAGYLKYNSLIELKIILRDSNLKAIEEYFTEGNPRSIPKIVGFDEEGNELFIWGPRPKFAQDLVQQLKAEGFSKEEFNKQLHTWYAKNKGVELGKELIQIFNKLNKI